MNSIRRNRVAYYLIAPAILILVVTSLYPAVFSFILSFFNWNWGVRFDFIGLGNYADLFGSAEFWQVLYQTFLFAIVATALELVLGLGLAVVVDQLKFGAGIIRTLLLTPLMVSGIIVALMSKILLDPMLGLVNYVLGALGLPLSPFFGATSTAMGTVIMVDAWWQTAFVFIIVLAGLQSLPQEPIEAARVDGANSIPSSASSCRCCAQCCSPFSSSAPSIRLKSSISSSAPPAAVRKFPPKSCRPWPIAKPSASCK